MGAASIAFLLDEYVAHAVAQALRRRGIDAETATEAGLLGATDAEFLAYARQAGRVVVTHDDDFYQRQLHAGMDGVRFLLCRNLRPSDPSSYAQSSGTACYT